MNSNFGFAYMPTIDSISVPNIINDENDISKGKENICNRYINSINSNN